MTPNQVFAVAAIGGFAAVIGLLFTIALAVGVHAAFQRLVTALDESRQRRRDLSACRAIEALGTTTEPQDRA
ncbi:hypothetical protein [Streptomyces sp. JB150]|uniref:hypothetical protein n=1 Tax=Streptomyces sp. JB150 TaxID=2714844 RepID=UPI00140A2D8C|nr:hypothetical protein [Streptomyces sp. JB150]QIJ62584.1 hypothetical protein G7Z13_11455 [Streptomyces sp. JB150]